MMRRNLMAAWAACALGLVLAAPPARADAICGQGATVVFACQLEGVTREVTVCERADGRMVYRYGRPGGAPELELVRRPDQLVMRPWNGIGSYYWAYLGFVNQSYRYEVGYNVRRGDGSDPVLGTLEVYKGDSAAPIVSRTCIEASLVHRLDEITQRR